MGTTVNGAIPFPDTDSRVTDLPADFQDAMERIDELLVPSKIALSLQNGWVVQTATNADPFAHKVGNLVVLSGLIRSGSTTGGAIIATLPTGWRPLKQHYWPVVTLGGEGSISVDADGNIRFQGGNNGFLGLNGLFPIT